MRVPARATPGETSRRPRSLRVDVVTDTYPPEVNGVAMTMGRLVDGLRRRGHRVGVIRARQQVELDARNGGDRTHLGSIDPGDLIRPSLGLPKYPGIRLGLPARGQLLGRWRRDRPDLVHIVTEGMLGWSALNAARRLGLPTTSGFHTNFHEYVEHYRFAFLARGVRIWLRHFHNRTQATFVPTSEMQSRLTEIGFERVEVLSRGVDTELFDPARRDPSLRAAWGAGPSDVVLIYVGRLAPEKNLQLALETFDALRAVQPEARLVLVGGGPSRETLGERPGVVLAGTQRGETLAAHYASGDLFVFPSLTETFGNVVLEGMASGLPLVAFRYAASAIHGRDDENARVVRFGDSDAWRTAVIELAQSAERREALGRAARADVERVGWDEIVTRFESLLEGIVATHRRPAR